MVKSFNRNPPHFVLNYSFKVLKILFQPSTNWLDFVAFSEAGICPVFRTLFTRVTQRSLSSLALCGWARTIFEFLSSSYNFQFDQPNLMNNPICIFQLAKRIFQLLQRTFRLCRWIVSLNFTKWWKPTCNHISAAK